MKDAKKLPAVLPSEAIKSHTH